MAIVAGISQISKQPFIMLFVAFGAGCGHVRPFQWKISLVMPCDAECRAPEAFHSMAVGTIANLVVFPELSFVIVIMAIGTRIMCDRVGIRTGVAFFAVELPVFSFERIVSAAMIETVERTRFLKRLLIMAIAAFLPKPFIVRVVMAIAA